MKKAHKCALGMSYFPFIICGPIRNLCDNLVPSAFINCCICIFLPLRIYEDLIALIILFYPGMITECHYAFKTLPYIVRRMELLIKYFNT